MNPRRNPLSHRRAAYALCVFLCCWPPPAWSRDETGNGAPARIFTEEEAVNLAVTTSLELDTERMNIAAAEAGQKASLRQYLPQMSISLSGDNTVQLLQPDSRMKRIDFTLTQPVYNGGRTELGRKIAFASIMISKKQLVLAREQLADSVRSLFLMILVQEEKIRIQKENLSLIENELTASRLEQTLGLSTELDLLTAELKSKTLAASVSETELTLKEMLFSLKQLLSLPAKTELKLEGEFDSSYEGMQIEADSEELFLLAKNRSLEVAASDLEIRKAAEELKLAGRSFVPSISLESSAFVQGEAFPLQEAGFTLKVNIDFPEPLLPVSSAVSAGMRGSNQTTRGGSVTAPVLPDLTGPITVRSAGYALRVKRLEAEKALETLDFSINRALALYEAAKRKCVLLREALGLARKKMIILEKQAGFGEITRLSLVEARLNLSEQELELLDQVKKLKEMERELEILTGLPPGGLNAYARKEAGS